MVQEMVRMYQPIYWIEVHSLYLPGKLKNRCPEPMVCHSENDLPWVHLCQRLQETNIYIYIYDGHPPGPTQTHNAWSVVYTSIVILLLYIYIYIYIQFY